MPFEPLKAYMYYVCESIYIPNIIGEKEKKERDVDIKVQTYLIINVFLHDGFV